MQSTYATIQTSTTRVSNHRILALARSAASPTLQFTTCAQTPVPLCMPPISTFNNLTVKVAPDRALQLGGSLTKYLCQII